MSFLPTKIGWFRLPEHAQAISDRVTVLEASPAIPTLQQVTTQGNITADDININTAGAGAKYYNAQDTINNTWFYAGSDGYMGVSGGTGFVDINGLTQQMIWSTGPGASLTLEITSTAARAINFPDASGDLIVQTTVPTTATDPGLPGQIAYDANFFYACVALNTWVRAALATW